MILKPETNPQIHCLLIMSATPLGNSVAGCFKYHILWSYINFVIQTLELNLILFNIEILVNPSKGAETPLLGKKR